MTTPLTESYWPAAPDPDEQNVAVGAALVSAAAKWPDRLAIIEGTNTQTPRTWTYSELHETSHNVARALLTRFKPFDRIAVWSTNRPEWLFLQFGAALAGLTLVTVNTAYGAAELHYVLNHSRVCGLFVEPETRPRDVFGIATSVAESLPALKQMISLDSWESFVSDGDHLHTRLPDIQTTEPAQIQYTSGTTGFPKGALLAHRGLTLNGLLYANAIGAKAGDVWINPMPLFHTAGCGLVTLGALQTGGTQVLPRRFDADLMLDLFQRHAGTILLSVPTMLIRILEAQRQRPRDLESWRLCTLGGAPVPPELVQRAQSELGVAVAIGFGQTESSPYITHTLPSDTNPEWAQTVGRPLPLIEVKIANLSGGKPVPVGHHGEICTRSACVMLEYFDNPDATADAIDDQRWLHTGDTGTMDAQGYIRVDGRLKDLIIRGGENIYPREIEDVLFTHDSIVNVSVVGLPDADWGESVAAFVQLRPGDSPDEQELESFCRARIASYKVPRQWIFVAEFPQTSSGKVQKFVLRDRYLDQR